MGVSGRAQTLHPDLPRESMVAQMGILGWDPHRYYPGGRSSAELWATHRIKLDGNDLSFRANLSTVSDGRLVSYNAGYIDSVAARALVSAVDDTLSRRYHGIRLYHLSDFRTAIVVRNANTSPAALECIEPHEREGDLLDVSRLISMSGRLNPEIVRLNSYLVEAQALLAGNCANTLIPWSPASALNLSPFGSTVGTPIGRTAIVGFMDFLGGIAGSGGMEFHRVGNGRLDTDYAAKGAKVVELLKAGCAFVMCHINSPDEMSHMVDLQGKIYSLEQIDMHIVAPIVRYFRSNGDEHGGVLLLPDHYSNTVIVQPTGCRRDIHSLDPVPFVLWDGVHSDDRETFCESESCAGAYGHPCLHVSQLMPLLFNRGERVAACDSTV
ncbi:MAG: 2,3-bisphosphoglycerate-independent phosphoglycerate mutase 1 [Acidobacteriaceae bacterium]|nr:2,3-bisphosphoglycerate-independent phosphoglycerate mutase 1 [Acidobacteriaceae bacterium]